MTPPPKPTLGQSLRALIEARRGPRAIAAVARDAGISTDYLYALIYGAKSNPSLDVLSRICAACGATIADLG